jgi:hypothetical protein
MTDINTISSNSSPNAISQGFSPYPGQNGADTHVATMNFDDFLDMVNPLQHIPVVSSIYRAVSGETINPISRIAGDTLYGGIFGLAAAGLGAIGAIGDEVLTASNGGQSASSTVIAALFGSDTPNTTQTAAATPSNAETETASQSVDAAVATDISTPMLQAGVLQTPARQSPILDIPNLSTPSTAVAAVTPVPSSTMTAAATLPASSGATTDAKTGLPLDRSKLAYGGVMDTAMMQNAIQNQSLALALASGQDNLQSQHALRNGRFATNGASTVTNPTQQSASLPLPGSTPSLTSWSNNGSTPANGTTSTIATTPAPNNSAQTLTSAQALSPSITQSLPSGLRQSMPQGAAEMKAIKGLDQYRNTAQKVPTIGAAVDVTN